MPLSLRPTGLSSPVYRDQLDYTVFENGRSNDKPRFVLPARRHQCTTEKPKFSACPPIFSMVSVSR
jgi:hypothetical protein